MVVSLSKCISVLSCHDVPIKNARVEAWKNLWIPFHLPLKLGETKTDEDRMFMLATEKGTSFFVFSGENLNFSSHSKETMNKCAN